MGWRGFAKREQFRARVRSFVFRIGAGGIVLAAEPSADLGRTGGRRVGTDLGEVCLAQLVRTPREALKQRTALGAQLCTAQLCLANNR